MGKPKSKPKPEEKPKPKEEIKPFDELCKFAKELLESDTIPPSIMTEINENAPLVVTGDYPLPLVKKLIKSEVANHKQRTKKSVKSTSGLDLNQMNKCRENYFNKAQAKINTLEGIVPENLAQNIAINEIVEIVKYGDLPKKNSKEKSLPVKEGLYKDYKEFIAWGKYVPTEIEAKDKKGNPKKKIINILTKIKDHKDFQENAAKDNIVAVLHYNCFNDVFVKKNETQFREFVKLCYSIDTLCFVAVRHLHVLVSMGKVAREEQTKNKYIEQFDEIFG